MRAMSTCILVMSLACCGNSGAADADLGCAISGVATLEVGVPDPITFLDFQTLASGGDIPLSSNGQTFLAVQLAIRATNMDRFAHIEMSVTYQPMQGPARVAIKDGTDLERLFCRSDDMLYLVPVVVSSQDLGGDIEIQDGAVDVSVMVTDDQNRTASATTNGILRRI